MNHAQRRRDQQQGDAVGNRRDPAAQAPGARERLDESLQGAGHEQGDDDRRQPAVEAGLEKRPGLPGLDARKKEGLVCLD